MPTKVYFGRDIVDDIKTFLSITNTNKILLVCGEHFKKSRNYINLLDNLKHFSVEVYQQKIKKSDYSTINKITEYCRKKHIDMLIGIGGGVILDTAKCASILTTHEGIVEDYVFSKTKKVIKRGIFYLAIPTTAGTGSEVTPWATIWGENKRKYSLSSKKFMFPDIAIVDPALTDALPKQITAASGIDALCQAIEAYWNINHNEVSDAYALEAIKIIVKNLENAVNNPSKQVRDNMAWGSLLEGLAFSNTQTTVCHAVSYPLTAYWNIPHGQATSLTLPPFIEEIVPRISKHRQNKLLTALGVSSISDAALMVGEIMVKIGLKNKLSDLHIAKEDIIKIARESFYTERVKSTPVRYTQKMLTELLFTIY